MKTITVELSRPLTYTGKDGEVSASFIELREPTGEVSHICCELESLITSSIVRMQGLLDEEVIETAKTEIPDEKKTPAAEEVMTLVMSAGVDMGKVTVHCRELFKSVAFMGGEKALTVPRMKDLTHSDFRKLMGEYIGNFILS